MEFLNDFKIPIISNNDNLSESIPELWFDPNDKQLKFWNGVEILILPNPNTSGGDKNCDGGRADSIYTPDQLIDGGGA
jgi:hypothetical protein